MAALPTPPMPTLGNEYDCTVELHRHPVNDEVVNYRIMLPSNETSMDDVVYKTEDLFTAICTHYIDNVWKARLMANCWYERINNEGEVIGREAYHHPSYYSEWCSVMHAEEFYRRHLRRIVRRIESFLCNASRNASSLRFVGYKHIHVTVSVTG